MSRSYLSILAFSIIVMLSVFSCKRDAPIQDQAVIEVDFMLNEQDLEKFGLEYTEQEFERDNNDPNKILTVKVGEPVKFKDTSKGSSKVSLRKWQLNQQDEWEQAKGDDEVDVPEFVHTFDTPGIHRISLYIGETNYATKLVKVVSGEYIPDNVVELEDVAAVEEETEDLFANNDAASTQANNNTSNASPEPARKTPPVKKAAPVKINSINFVLPSEVMLGESFELRDISSPSNAIKVRQWDMGDGETLKTAGATYRKVYFSTGVKTVTLCLNNTNQCTSKRITVKPKPARKETVAAPKPKKQPVKVSKPSVASVDFNLPATAIVGSSVSLLDKSSPASAVVKRRWKFGDGSADLNTGKSAIGHVYNTAGTYTVELCVNDSDKCSKKTITIAAKPEANTASTTTKPTSSSPLDDYEGSTPGRVGLTSSMKCGDQNFDWHEGNIFLNLTPKKMMELETVKVFSSGNGTVDIILTTGDKKQTGTINNVQLNPGSSVIYLSDLAVILMPGEKYTLMLKPNTDLKFENAVKCNPKPIASDVVSVSYNNNFVLYDLKFYY